MCFMCLTLILHSSLRHVQDATVLAVSCGVPVLAICFSILVNKASKRIQIFRQIPFTGWQK